MGQTCQTCVTTNIDFIPSQNIDSKSLQSRLNSLRYELMKDQTCTSKEYKINEYTVFLGRLNQTGKKQGYGELTCGNKFFAGNFSNDLPQGKGVLIENDYFYYGNFVAGKPHGDGHQKNDNFQFIGEFLNGQRKNGKMTHSQYIYEGQFRNNLFEGKGKINYTCHFITYQGSFKNGKFHGDGLITFKDKYKYQGEFREGNYHGKGLMLSQCGQIFEGNFENGVKNGNGWVKTTDGHEIMAKWKNCNLHGDGVIIVQGEKVKVQWLENQLKTNE